MSILRDHWYWHPPDREDWWRFKVSRGGDEFCNTALIIRLPLLGLFDVFKPGRLRDEADEIPCPSCRREIMENPAVRDTVDRHVWVAWCDECQDDWYLPRDRDRPLCDHLTRTHGTSSVPLACHIRIGRHHTYRGHEPGERAGRCPCWGRYDPREIFAAETAWGVQKIIDRQQVST